MQKIGDSSFVTTCFSIDYQGLCDTLKYTNMNAVQDLQVRGMFIKLAAIC